MLRRECDRCKRVMKLDENKGYRDFKREVEIEGLKIELCVRTIVWRKIPKKEVTDEEPKVTKEISDICTRCLGILLSDAVQPPFNSKEILKEGEKALFDDYDDD